ncbi:hypothetical protein GGI04_002088 [Coemansia thaxteri]|uniref:Thioredoxin domain-containing protein n=1 Tax=Coemansia thaxteri TaxID=2663907 RepID=A0A9W8BI31_9FUNG|nr:hypothetical protein H4R26_003940 [Coemansia thaxteri]KAJ2005837.1 hypothetical protein GGI04_002088 [Coemansia thaxteri]
MKCIRVFEPASFDNLVSKALKESDAVFVLFYGREEASTGESWCSDCVIADPLVRKGLSKVDNCILLEVPVDRSLDQASATNIFRKRDDIQLARIPTLLRWSKEGPFATRLVEGECNELAIDEYVKQTNKHAVSDNVSGDGKCDDPAASK